ncbi:MAG: hypothetical protein WDO24_12235 [Pseudomonadota bacterium]
MELGKRHKPDLAILDMRLAEGGRGTDIVARLNRQDRRPGVLYATGNGAKVDLTKADGEAVIGKPYRSADVIRALEIVEQIVSTGEASLPFPQGFHLLGSPSTSDSEPRFENLGSDKDIKRLLRQQAALAKSAASLSVNPISAKC